MDTYIHMRMLITYWADDYHDPKINKTYAKTILGLRVTTLNSAYVALIGVAS